MVKPLLQLFLLILLIHPAILKAQHSEIQDSSAKTSIVIKVIKGGPCGDSDPALVDNDYVNQKSIDLDLACSCFQSSMVRKEEE